MAQSSSRGSLSADSGAVHRRSEPPMVVEACYGSAPCWVMGYSGPARLSPWELAPRTRRLEDRKDRSLQKSRTQLI